MATVDRGHARRRDKLHLRRAVGSVQGLHFRGDTAFQENDEILGELCQNGVSFRLGDMQFSNVPISSFISINRAYASLRDSHVANIWKFWVPRMIDFTSSQTFYLVLSRASLTHASVTASGRDEVTSGIPRYPSPLLRDISSDCSVRYM